MNKYDDFEKLEMIVGKVLEVERIPDADKLYKLQVDLGEEEPRQIVSGLVHYYTEDELMGRKVIVLVNLKPVKLRGEMSNGMLLCASDEDKDQCILLSVEKDIEVGAKVS